jgi:hypothetical protein
MKHRINLILAIAALAAFILGGCATIPRDAPPYSRAPDAPPRHQNVYIYRLNTPSYFGLQLRTPAIAVDGFPVFDPPENAYTVLALPEGIHQLTSEWSWDLNFFPKSIVLPITVTSTEPLYIKIGGQCLVAALDLSFLGSSHRICTSLQIIPQSQAESELTSCCRYIAPNPRFQPENAIR